MIIQNDIHQALVDASTEQGWNEESQIIHLCGFLERLKPYIPLTMSFQAYLQEVADEENEGAEATCEHCGAACDYHSDLCLCENCFWLMWYT